MTPLQKASLTGQVGDFKIAMTLIGNTDIQSSSFWSLAIVGRDSLFRSPTMRELAKPAKVAGIRYSRRSMAAVQNSIRAASCM
jgi:hypothetical protein